MAPTRILFSVITHNDDISLQCATSLLKLQQLAARRQDIVLDFHILNSVGDALNLYNTGDYLCIVDGQNGFSAEFIFGAVDHKHAAVLGVYPLPQVDWERVKARVQDETATETVGNAGNVYNLVPAEAAMGRYIPVKSVRECKVMCLQCDVIKNMVGDHTKTTKNGKEFHILHFESSADGAFNTPDQTFFRALQRYTHVILADIEEQCTYSGNAQFSGCVGQRGFIR